jgi:hypothetical protein
VVPLSVMVNPIKEIPDVQLLPYEPVRCRGCAAVLNPYARVDFQGKVWVCPFCLNRNHLPPTYHQVRTRGGLARADKGVTLKRDLMPLTVWVIYFPLLLVWISGPFHPACPL